VSKVEIILQTALGNKAQLFIERRFSSETRLQASFAVSQRHSDTFRELDVINAYQSASSVRKQLSVDATAARLRLSKTQPSRSCRFACCPEQVTEWTH